MMHTINFPCFFLEEIHFEILLQTIFYHQDDETTKYKLKKIVDCAKGMYLIHWRRYPNSKDT